MVSIIISTYNRASLLKKAIKSVLEQSYKDFELLVVDDCSTDRTKRTVKSMCDPRIKYLVTKKNSGHDGYPKNYGIKNATRPYVAFLDDDDTYRPDAIKILLRYAMATNADAVYGDYLINGKPGWSMPFSAQQLMQMNYVSMSTVLVKRSALLSVGGFDEKVPKFKDWNLWCRLSKRGFQFMHVPIITTNVTTQKQSVSSKFKAKAKDGRLLPTYFSPVDCKTFSERTCLGSPEKPAVAVFTMTWDRLEYTKRMVSALVKNAGYPFDWFVVDQGSTDGTVKWLKSEAPVRGTVLNASNVGIAKGWNQAVELIKKTGKYDIIIKVDNDCELLTPRTIAAVVDIYERNRKFVLSPCVEGLEDSPGGVLRQSEGASPYAFLNERVLGIVPYLGGIFWAAPSTLYDNFAFDEETFIAGNKDYLISQYAKSAGYGLFYLEEFRVKHMDGTVGQREKYPDYYERALEAQRTK